MRKFSKLIKDKLNDLVADIKQDCLELDVIEDSDIESGITLTIGFNENLLDFGYQTGDNSFNGDAYFYPNWVVVDIDSDTDIELMTQEIEEDYFNTFD
jgi:hypothetical protein